MRNNVLYFFLVFRMFFIYLKRYAEEETIKQHSYRTLALINNILYKYFRFRNVVLKGRLVQ